MSSPHHAILISRIHSLGIAVPTVSPPTARLFDDEILTLIQAQERKKCLSVASPEARVDRRSCEQGTAGWCSSLLRWMWPPVRPGEGCSTDTLARLHEDEGSTPVQGINPARRPWGRSAAGLIYLAHCGRAAEAPVPNPSRARQLSRLCGAGVLACRARKSSQSSYTIFTGMCRPNHPPPS